MGIKRYKPTMGNHFYSFKWNVISVILCLITSLGETEDWVINFSKEYDGGKSPSVRKETVKWQKCYVFKNSSKYLWGRYNHKKHVSH